MEFVHRNKGNNWQLLQNITQLIHFTLSPFHPLVSPIQCVSRFVMALLLNAS